jgi:fibronectin-binding autotransporter adhesin
MSSFHCRLCFATAVTLLAVQSTLAQNTQLWTGLAGPDQNWATLGNWNSDVPISGDTAVFNSTGNGNTSVSLGGSTQPINTIRFDGAANTPYALGVLASGDTFAFDSGGMIVVASNITAQQTINAAIMTNGPLTVTNSGSMGLALAGNISVGGTFTVNNAIANTTTTLGGNITDSLGGPGSLSLLATATGFSNNNNFIINGTNTYSGPTMIEVNMGNSGRIQLGSNSPFGTGAVNLTQIPGNFPARLSAVGGDRTISNAFSLNSDLSFAGTNRFFIDGPLTIINPDVGGSRWLSNSILSGGKAVTFGASPGSSTITLGNPSTNGGDNIGKTLVFSPNAFATFIVNDVIQDPAPGGGAASGSVRFAGQDDGTTSVMGLNTYTGPTHFDGWTTVRIGSSSNVENTAGPFGTGTLMFNAFFKNMLQPIGGNRTVANPISLIEGMTVENATGGTDSLTFTGPISVTSSGRQIDNYFGTNGGTLTLGSAANPSTITLHAIGGNLTFGGTGTTVINDIIENGPSVPSALATDILINTTGPITLNAHNTYTGDTTIMGFGTTVRLGASSNSLPGLSFTAGPFGTGTLTINSLASQILEPIGADRTIANPITMFSSFTAGNATVAQDPTGAHNLTFTGSVTVIGAGLVFTNNLVAGVALTLGSVLSPSTISFNNDLTIQSQMVGGGLTIINNKASGAGGLLVKSGIVHLNGVSNYTGSTLVQNGAKLLVNGSKTGTGSVQINSTSSLGGTGSIAGSVTNSGTIAPGLSIGTLTVVGNVSMASNSHLAIELDGAAADKLVVGGNLNLSSVDYLDVTGIGIGPGWVIATYAGMLTGTFNNITPGYTVNYGSGTNSQITLIAPPSGVQGDFNNDGRVDAGDYIIWRKNNGTSNPLLNSNGLGTPIDQSHYNLWRSNFGNPPGSGGGVGSEGAVTSIPEPSTIMLLNLGVLLLQRIRRHGA